MEYISHYNSPLGGITITADDKGITGLWFDRQKYFGDIKGSTERDVEYLSEARKWLDIYFGGQAPDFTPPLSLSGSEFRKSVARIMLGIPFGQTMTYGEIAAMISPKMAAQAVGGAVGHNPIGLIIPCHRVMGAGGKLTGYGGGLDRKQWLLEHERRIIS